ncbi:MAG: ABC transporter substrate-binding protein [Saprospiraceae bacterium]
MILAQNLLRQLSGNKIWILIFAVGIFTSCELFKPAGNGNNNNNNNTPDEIGEIGGTTNNDRDNDGVIDDYDKCPDEPGLVRLEGCPEGSNNSGNNTGNTGNTGDTGKINNDRDNDGVTDKYDKCPDEPGLIRLEGCPESKNDNGNTTGNNTGNTGGNTGNDDPVSDPKGVDTTTTTEDPVINSNLKSSYKVGILMPFFADEVSNAMTMPKQAIPGMNFYEGSLMALQQLSMEGVNLDVEVFDSRRSQGVVQGLVDNFTLNSMDLIIGPGASSNVRIVAEQVAKKEEVPMVSLNLNSTLTSDNPYFIQSSPYFSSHAAATVKYVKENYDGKKVIMVVPNGGKEMSRLQYYRNANNLQSGGVITNSFTELLAEKAGSSFSFDGLTDALTLSDTTVIIAPVSNEFFANKLLRTLSAVKGSKPVVVFGMPNWMKYQNLDVSTLERCNVHVTNGSFVNNNDENIKSFKQNFFAEYGAVPTMEAYKGYDLTLYFGRMLHKHGTDFINKLDAEDETLLQSSFNFERVFAGTADGEMGEDFQINYIENKFVHILRFKNYQYVPMNNPNNVFSNFGND